VKIKNTVTLFHLFIYIFLTKKLFALRNASSKYYEENATEIGTYINVGIKY